MKHGGLGKTVSRILVFCLLLGCATCRSDFVGPGISSAQALAVNGQLTPVTQTDVVFPSASVAPMATTTRVNNILVAVYTKTNSIRDIYFSLTNSLSATKLQMYDYGTVAKSMVDIYDASDDAVAEQLIIDFRPLGKAAKNQSIVLCGFNTTAAANTAISSISTKITSGYYYDSTKVSGEGEPISPNDSNVLTTTKVYLGDVNKDGAVNAIDAQLVLQYATGKATLENDQKLAADVNRDGAIDAVDAMKINQYAVSKILSFWGTDAIEDLPDSGPSGITSGGIYYLKNGKYVYGDSDLTCNLKSFTNNTTSSNHNFIVEFSGALCTIRNGLNGKHLQLDTDYNATFKTTNVISFSSFWYFVPVSGGGYRLVNYANPHRMLNIVDDVCVASRLYSGSVWTFEPLTINIKNYYDYGYKVRVSSNTVSSIQQNQNTIKNIISTVFKVSATASTPQLWQSYGDKCYSSTSAITTSNINKHCSCNGVSNTACANFPTGAVNSISNITNVHHKNSQAALFYLYFNKQNTSVKRDIQLLTSGYGACGKETGGTQHDWEHVGGLASTRCHVCAVFHGSSGNTYKNDMTALHEISHLLGALPSDDCPADTVHNNGLCVMSYEREDYTLKNYWQAGNYRSLYCTKCYQAIVKGLKTY